MSTPVLNLYIITSNQKKDKKVHVFKTKTTKLMPYGISLNYAISTIMKMSRGITIETVQEMFQECSFSIYAPWSVLSHCGSSNIIKTNNIQSVRLLSEP